MFVCVKKVCWCFCIPIWYLVVSFFFARMVQFVNEELLLYHVFRREYRNTEQQYGGERTFFIKGNNVYAKNSNDNFTVFLYLRMVLVCFISVLSFCIQSDWKTWIDSKLNGHDYWFMVWVKYIISIVSYLSQANIIVSSILMHDFSCKESCDLQGRLLFALNILLVCNGFMVKRLRCWAENHFSQVFQSLNNWSMGHIIHNNSIYYLA